MIPLDIVWAFVGVLIVMLNFLPNKMADTNCRYIYAGNILVFLGVLVGLSHRPVIAASIVLVGVIVVIWAAMFKLHKHEHRRILK